MDDLRMSSSAVTGTRYRNPNGSETFMGTPDVSTVVLLVVVALAIIYQCFVWSDSLPLLSIQEIAWNCLVYVIPSRVIFAIDERYTVSNPPSKTEDLGESGAKLFAAKSDAMRRLIGLDSDRLFGSVSGPLALPGLRRLSTVERKASPPGLGNWDNSCYQNSIIQGLASLRSLPTHLDYILSVSKDVHEGASRARTTAALQEVTQQLENPDNAGKRIWTPASLKSMSSWQQQDAQEYFSKVMEEVDKELSQALQPSMTAKKLGLVIPDQSMNKSKDKSKVDTIYTSITTASNEGLDEKKRFRISDTSRNPLDGLIAQRVGCVKCGQSDGLSLIPFNCLTVPLGRDMYYDIRECLDEFTALETIDGVDCAKCTLLSSKLKLQSMVIIDKESEHSSQQAELQGLVQTRLDAIDGALEEDDFSDTTLKDKCKITPGSKVSTTKTRQAVIARPPESLVIHINRSLFNEHTGMLSKNYANVRFQRFLNLGSWCLGIKFGAESRKADDVLEEWNMDPTQSLLGNKEESTEPQYEIRAVVIHQGRHENGHYITYRKYSPPLRHTSVDDKSQQTRSQEQWWRLSDDDVDLASAEEVFDQGGAFMLFYERTRNVEVSDDVPVLVDTDSSVFEVNSTVARNEILHTMEVEESSELGEVIEYEDTIPEESRLPHESRERDTPEYTIPLSSSTLVPAN